MGFFKNMIGGTARESDLVSQVRAASGEPIEREQVGFFKCVKHASELPEADAYAQTCAESTITMLAQKVQAMGEFGEPTKMMGKGIGYMAVLHQVSNFRIDQLTAAMGEVDSAHETTIGLLAIDLLGTAQSLGGHDDPAATRRLITYKREDQLAYSKILAWISIGLIRLSNKQEIPRFDALPAWDVY